MDRQGITRRSCDRVSSEVVGKRRGFRSQLIPITVVVAATATVFVVFLAVFEVALGIVVVSHIVVFVLVEFVVFELLDLVVVGVLLLRRFVFGLVLGFVGVVEVCELVAGRLCVDFERLLARVRVVALAFGINYVPELFGEVFFFCSHEAVSTTQQQPLCA